MKFVVTGATGFVGRHTVQKLLSYGYQVVSVTTNRSISDSVKGYIEGSDIFVLDSLEEISEDIIRESIIIHCAWSKVPATLDVSHYFHAVEHIKFISKIAKFKPKKVIVTGSCIEFGLHEGAVSVQDKPEPNTPYAQAKDFVRCACERILKDGEGIDFVWARLFYMYGDGQHEKAIYSQLINSIKRKDKTFNMSKGEQLYDYMNVKEVAEKLCVLATNLSPTIVHVSNGYPTLLRGLVEDILLQNDSSLKLNLGFFPYRIQDSLALWGAESFESQLECSHSEE